MTVKTAAFAAALLALPAAFAAPANAHGMPMSSHLAEISALDASSFAISIGSRRTGSVGVLVGRKKEAVQPRTPVRAARVRIF